ncbi:MAG: malto-oligosyltrehalose trehalohydrolase, partial [Calditrichaeota bacterium]
RNWGYDGVYPFAVQHSYGGPPGLKHFVNTCHEQGFAVILDVVYNHLGPEGNYLRDFGPYFTDRYKTPWGEAVNFDDAWSDDVRNYFIENALHWFKNYHIDALRLDAIHAITDMSAHPFLQELAEKTEDFSRHQNREYILIAESSLNDARIVKAGSQGGFGIQAQWLDDFHHSLRTILTGEKTGYYMDFGKKEQFEKSLNDGFVYDGDYSAFRRRRHGNSSSEISAGQFVVFIQNHDQVGNRMLGERLTELTSFEAHKLAAAACLLSPYLPMIFMGEEYGEKAPFLYFVDHGDPNLVDAVRNGRKKEFSQFQWRGEPPDPQDEDTFSRSKIDISLKSRDHHRYLFKFYKELIRLRQNYPALKNLSNKKLKTGWDNTHNILVIHRWEGSDEMLILMNLNKEETKLSLEIPEGYWMKILDSNDSDWGGNGSVLPHELETGAGLTLTPREFILYHKENSK